MQMKVRAMRLTATLLSFALIQVSFGPEAWAQLVPQIGAVAAPVGGASAAAGSVNASRFADSAAIAMPSAASLTVSPTAVPSALFSAPSAVASLPFPPIGATPASGLAAPAAAAAFVRQPHAAPAFAASVAAPANEGRSVAAKRSARTPAVETKLESRLNTAAVRSRMARRVAELKNFFTDGRDAGPTASESASATGAAQNGALRSNGLAAANGNAARDNGGNAPPAPSSAPPGPKEGGKSKAPWLGLGAAGAAIIAYALTMQVGLEAQGVAMPQLTENAFKDFTLLPLVSIFASIGSMIGQPMSKFFSERFGLAKTFYGGHALRAISWASIVVLCGTGAMSIPLMMAFYLFNGVVTGIAATAEGTLKKLILAEKGVSQQSYRTWWQLLAESLAVPAPIFFGALVHSLGVIGAPLVTAVFPVTILLGLILAYLLRVYPLKDVKKASDQAARPQEKAASPETAASPAPAPAKTGIWKAVKTAASTILKNMEEGKNFVMGVPYLKFSLAAAAAFDLFNIIIYRLIAPGYGKMTGGATGLSAVQGNIVGMFSLGGLLLSIVFITLESVAKKRAAKNPPTSAAAAAAERSSMLRWAMAGIPALILLAAMAVHVVLPLAPLLFLGTNWMPSSILAAALIPFGFFQVAASIKLNSYFQEKLPQDAGRVQKALAFSGSVMTALSIVTMLALRPLFSAVAVFNPFPWLAMALVPVAAGLFFLQRKLAAATKPAAVAAADEAQKRREQDPRTSKASGGYVGLILGIVAATLVITALPMIPGLAGALAGLGVLAKFAVNLSLTLLIPLAGYVIDRVKGRSKAR